MDGPRRWSTDAAGHPARNAPPFDGKRVPVDFDPNAFDRAIQEHGERLVWEQAARCPCAANEQTGQPDPLCPVCRGVGWEYHSPLLVRGIVDRLEMRLDALERLGDWVFGSVMVTVQPLHRPGFRDRFRLVDAVVTHSEVVTRRHEGPDRLAFPVAALDTVVLAEDPATGEQVRRNLSLRVIRLRLMTPETRRPGPILQEGLDFEVTGDGRIDWAPGDARGTAPRPATGPMRPGDRYAVTYHHHPSYLVQNWPYPFSTLHVQRKSPVQRHVAGPVSAIALMEARADRPPAEAPGD